MSDPYDFQIGDLKFRAAISDKFPYQRGTAQFRKEQFDSAPTVGDQSLSGWWTRGQLSFHKGAGVKYYEVLEGEEILNRFSDSENVDVWTPGRVALPESGSDAFNPPLSLPTNVRSQHQGQAVVDDGDYLWVISGPDTSSPTSSLWSDGTAIPTVNSNPYSLAADESGTRIYVATGNTIEVIEGTGTPSLRDPSVVLWTNSNSATATDNEFVFIAWAKGRLWAVDRAGCWYALAASGGTIPPGGGTEVFWNSALTYTRNEPQASQSPWSFTSGPGLVYMARYDKVYGVGVSDTAALSAPTSVIELGGAEQITAIVVTRGRMALSVETGDGGYFVTASLGSDGGLTLNPVAWDDARNVSMGARGDLVYFCGSDGVYEANLAYETSPGVPAISRRAPATEGYGWRTVVTGSTTTYAFGVGATTAWGTWTGAELEESGFILTGFHRFGTLDSKHFQSVRVRVGGDGGTVTATLVRSDGTETMLGVASPGDPTDLDIGLTGPQESIALKFTLTRDPDNAYVGPELLGYQLKALPSPTRQRLIKVPVVAADVVRDRHGVDRGRRGAAYENWMRLEAMEEDDALVAFTDLRTGETGDVYIESVELQTDTPSRNGESGFGGIGYITLRKVSSA